ncbi:hypothetical protein [Arthrobacter sunyaminii]|nr:hypothetical protein [Arthrobacter sunyaminii]
MVSRGFDAVGPARGPAPGAPDDWFKTGLVVDSIRWGYPHYLR